MGFIKWLSSAPWRPSTFQRRILSLQLMVRSLSPCWIPSQVGTMALDSTGMVPSPGTNSNKHPHRQRSQPATMCFHSIAIRHTGEVWCISVLSLTILYFGAKLALLYILKQRLMALDFIPCLAAWLVKQSAVPTGCRAVDKKERTKMLLTGKERGKKEKISLTWCKGER